MHIRKKFSLLILMTMLFAVFPALSNAEMAVGGEFSFGSYEQDGIPSNGAEGITWIILSVDRTAGTMLVVSKYCLDCQVYNKDTKKTPWKNSYIRGWLNTDFFDATFTDAQKQSIVETTASNSKDKIFLLDAKQIQTLLTSDLCLSTAYAKNNGVYVATDTGNSSWWVRTDSTSKNGVFVGAHGGIYEKGNKVTVKNNGVRPAIVLNISRVLDAITCSIDDLQLNKQAAISNWGTVEVTDCEFVNRLGYYHAGSSSVDSQTWHDSGNNEEFLVLKANITNDGDSSRDFISNEANVSVTVIYDESYYFGGWSFQYNWSNQTNSGSDYAAENADAGNQNRSYVINKADNFSIAPGETGNYCFGCTVPNAVAQGNESVKMVLNIDGYEMTYVIR